MKEGWEYKKLDDICSSIEDGDWIESKDQSPNGIRLIQTGNIGNGSYKDKKDNAKYISEETFKRLHCTEIFEGDILVSRLPDPVGRACTLPDLGCRCITAVDCSILKIKKDLVCNAWITYFMQSQAYFTIINSQCTGSTRLRITRKKLAEILIPVPPLSEQQSIVDYLDSAFAKIDAMKANAEKALNEAKALFQASLKEMLEPKEGWEEKTLKEITSEIGDGLHGTPKYSDDGNYFFVNGNNFENGLIEIKDNTKRIGFEEYEKYKIDLNTSTVLLSINGTIGKTAFYDGEPIILGKSACYINVLPALLKEYLRYFLLSDFFVIYAKKNARQATIVNLGLKELRNMPIPLPPLSEQQRIVATLDSLKSKVDSLQENYDKISQECDALKQAILRQVFE